MGQELGHRVGQCSRRRHRTTSDQGVEGCPFNGEHEEELRRALAPPKTLIKGPSVV